MIYSLLGVVFLFYVLIRLLCMFCVVSLVTTHQGVLVMCYTPPSMFELDSCLIILKKQTTLEIYS